MHYRPQRFDVQLQYSGKAFSTVLIELALDGLSGADDLIDAIDLGWFRIETLPIPCLSIPCKWHRSSMHAPTSMRAG